MSTQLEVPAPAITGAVVAPQHLDDEQLADPPRWTVWHLFWLGLFLATLPMLIVYFSWMWALSHYHYIPFAIGIVAWLAYTRSDRTIPPPAKWVSVALVVVSASLIAASLVLNSPWVGAVAFVILSAGLLSVLRGPLDNSLIGLCLPLLLIIRLPVGYDSRLIVGLQRVTTQLSSLLLDILAIPHAVARNTLQLAERELFVAEACSGIQSVFTLAFLSVLLIVFYRRKVWLAPLYLGISVILAVAGNVLRVSAVAASDAWFGVDLAEGWQHDVLGYTTLGIAVLFLLSFDRLIISFFHPISSSSTSTNPVVDLWNWLFDDGQTFDVREDYLASGKASTLTVKSPLNPWLLRTLQKFDQRAFRLGVVSVGAIVLLTSSVFAFSKNTFVFDPTGSDLLVDKMFVEPTEDFFKQVSTDFELSDYEISRGGENLILGKNADIWKYSRKLPSGVEVTAQLVVSQAYTNCHDLAVCYTGQDWTESFRRQIEGQSLPSEQTATSQEDQSFEYVQFLKPSGELGYLWFGGVGADGALVNTRGNTNRMISRLNSALDANRVVPGGLAIMQLWMVSFEKLDGADTAEIAKDFETLRVHLASAIAEQHSKTGQSE